MSELRNDIPGWEGSPGPFRPQYTQPHVYARDVHSGAGNCVCGAALGNPFRHYPNCNWIEPTPNPGATLELAARPAYGAFALCSMQHPETGDTPWPPWEEIPPQARADWRAVADAVRMVTR